MNHPLYEAEDCPFFPLNSIFREDGESMGDLPQFQDIRIEYPNESQVINPPQEPIPDITPMLSVYSRKEPVYTSEKSLNTKRSAPSKTEEI